MQSKLKTRKSHPFLLIGEETKQNSCPPRMREKASEASKRKFGLCHSGEVQNQSKCKNTNLILLNFRLSTFSFSSAFTLIELIVSITILAILGTISFIALQGFVADARDAKRISDINNLLEKINIEITRGMNLGDFITNKAQTGITINKTGAISSTGIINFDNLKENPDKFKDPNGTPYQFAYSEGQITKDNGEQEGYSFMQLATILEKTNKTKLVGNYFKYDEGDSPSLFKMQNGRYLVDGGSPEGITHTPLNPYEGEAGITQGSIHSSSTDLPNGWTDLIVRNGNGSGYVIMDRNLGAIEVYDGVEKSAVRGNYYQWGNNYGFPNLGNITTSATLMNTASRPYLNSTFIFSSSLNRYDWVKEKNDDLWGNITNTNIAKQGPCPSGWHIPSITEWGGLVNIWCSIKLGSSCSWNKTNITSFVDSLKLPLAGQRSWENGSLVAQKVYGVYWSSSHNSNVYYARSLHFDFSLAYFSSNHEAGRANGYSIRCFKN